MTYLNRNRLLLLLLIGLLAGLAQAQTPEELVRQTTVELFSAVNRIHSSSLN